MKLFGFGKKPGFSEVFKKGLEQYQAGNLNSAVGTFDEAINLRSDVPEIFYQRGLAYARLGQMPAAIQDFERVVTLGASGNLRRDACYNLGKACDELQRFEDSLRWYDQASQIDPSFAKIYANRAGVHLKLGEGKADLHEFELAATDLTTALSLNPSDALAYFNRALANIQMQNVDQVNEDLQKFLELAPSNHPYRQEVEKMLVESTRPASAKLDMLRERKQKDLLQKIIKANDEKQFMEAIQLCDRYLEERRTEAAVWDEKVFALWALNRQKEALAVCLEGISLNPGGARLYQTKGGLLAELGQYREAIGAFEKYLAISPPEYSPQFPKIKQQIEELKKKVPL